MSDSRRRKKLNVRVSPAKKQEWLDSLNEDETLTELIRRGVDKEIRGEYVSRDLLDDIERGTDSGPDIDPILARLDDLDRSVSSVEEKIDTVSVTQEGETLDNIDELALDVFPRLPSYPEEFPPEVYESVSPTEMEPHQFVTMLVQAGERSGIQIDGSAQRISTEMREPRYRVREACLYLEHESTETVHSAVVNGIRHWVSM